jgi:hypothetical protein
MASPVTAPTASVDPATIPATVQVVQLPDLDAETLEREPGVLDNYTPTIVTPAPGIHLIGWVCRQPHDDGKPMVLVLANPADGGGLTQDGTTLGEMAEQLGQHEQDEHGGNDDE